MADIRIDVSEILKDYLFPILGAGVVGLLLYQLFFHDWVWPTIISILLFLTIEFVIWCWKKRQYQKAIKKYQEEEDNRVKPQMNGIADKALCFFRSLNNYQLDAAVALYEYPQIPNSHYNERYVEFSAMPIFGKLPYLEDFRQPLLLNDFTYITCTNELESYNGGTRHYVIDPLFYEILKNYVENGTKDYPEGLDFMRYATYYRFK